MRKPLGFKAARQKIIRSMLAGPAYILFEPRETREGKNLLDTQEVTVEKVVRLLRRCRGDQFECSRHHRVAEVPVYIFKPFAAGVRWYVKAYFLDGDEDLEPVIFISVHRTQEE